jgi:hypothetical protein
VLQDLRARIRATDPKLVAAGVAYVLTYAVTDRLKVGREGPLLPLAAAAAAGWWTANAGTMLRTAQESGNAVQPQPAR